MTKSTTHTVASVKRRIKEEFDRQISKDWTDERIAERVRLILERDFQEIVAKSLGFSHSSWGRGAWEVDHCNGRAGESDVGTRIASAAHKAIEDVFTRPEHADKFKLTQAQIKAMTDEFKAKVSKHSLSKVVEAHVAKEVAKLDDLMCGKIKGAK